jgi:hypothetical protein
MLIIAMVSSGIFSVLLTSRTNEVRSDRRQQAVVFTQRLDSELQRYAGDANGSNGTNDLCQRLCNNNCGVAGCYAHLPNDLCSGGGANITAYTPGCKHNADVLLPSWFTLPPFNGHMCYSAGTCSMGGGWFVNKVVTGVVWEDPTLGPCAGPIAITCP